MITESDPRICQAIMFRIVYLIYYDAKLRDVHIHTVFFFFFFLKSKKGETSQLL
jgi:hypothetical protein